MEDNLHEIYQAAERSAEMTSQLLAFARKQTAVPRVIEIDETIADSLPILQRVAGEKIVIDWQPVCEECKLHIDLSQLDQILMTLCLNARDVMNGSGKIVIETKRIRIGASQHNGGNFMPPGNYAMLSVTDTPGNSRHPQTVHLRAVFYHQGAWQRHRSRTFVNVRHREATSRICRFRE